MLNAVQLEEFESVPANQCKIKSNRFYPVELNRAMNNDELRVHYQPRYSTHSGQVTVLEALVRWQHPALGSLAPDAFIGTAEEFGLISKLGLWVFEQCCVDIARLRRQLEYPVKIAVNVSLLQCEDPQQIAGFYDICQRYSMDFSDFEFELTESDSIQDKSSVQRFCDTLHDLGADISLDDFGTCYSPLNNLCDLPVNHIKIDRCFTSKIEHGGKDEILVRHLVKLAHEMDIKVVAEGIEHAYQRDKLISMGCDQLQGFYLCRPQHTPELSADINNMYTL